MLGLVARRGRAGRGNPIDGRHRAHALGRFAGFRAGTYLLPGTGDPVCVARAVGEVDPDQCKGSESSTDCWSCNAITL